MSEPDRPDRLAGESMRHYTRRPVPDRTCASCQHWGASYPSREAVGTCSRISDGSPLPYIGSHDEAVLLTPADFGCTLHQPTTEETSP